MVSTIVLLDLILVWSDSWAKVGTLFRFSLIFPWSDAWPEAKTLFGLCLTLLDFCLILLDLKCERKAKTWSGLGLTLLDFCCFFAWSWGMAWGEILVWTGLDFAWFLLDLRRRFRRKPRQDWARLCFGLRWYRVAWFLKISWRLLISVVWISWPSFRSLALTVPVCACLFSFYCLDCSIVLLVWGGDFDFIVLAIVVLVLVWFCVILLLHGLIWSVSEGENLVQTWVDFAWFLLFFCYCVACLAVLAYFIPCPCLDRRGVL